MPVFRSAVVMTDLPELAGSGGDLAEDTARSGRAPRGRPPRSTIRPDNRLVKRGRGIALGHIRMLQFGQRRCPASGELGHRGLLLDGRAAGTDAALLAALRPRAWPAILLATSTETPSRVRAHDAHQRLGKEREGGEEAGTDEGMSEGRRPFLDAQHPLDGGEDPMG